MLGRCVVRRSGVLTLASLVAVMAALSVAPHAAAIETSDRAEVERQFLDEVVPALNAPIGWTGNAASCDAGSPSPEAQAATLTTINFVRGLAQLDPVSFDPAYSAKAQQAALIMAANGDLNHQPPATWACWSQEGAEGAGSSNLCGGCSGANAIRVYMDDPGSSNTAVGHRRWIMRPQTATMGSGSTSDTNALWVFGADDADASVPGWVPWPTAGYFPSPLEPEGRWSLSASDPNVTFSGAAVTVHDAMGAALPVDVHGQTEGYGSNTLVWEVSGVEIPINSDAVSYTVRVSNIGGAGSTYEYEVKLFSPPFTNTTPPSISGDPKVGKRLAVSVGEWAPEPWSYAYRWFRSGLEIPGADRDHYRLTPTDMEETLTVEVTAMGPGYANTSYVSDPTAQVVRGDPLEASVRPSIYGTKRVGETLTVTAGDWSPAEETVAFEWFRDGVAIRGATESTHRLTRKDKGKRITATVTASKFGYADGSATSRATRRVKGRR